MLMIGFYFNAPLLPLYPYLVSTLKYEIGVINLILHSWLAFSWGLQFWGLRNFCKVFSDENLFVCLDKED